MIVTFSAGAILALIGIIKQELFLEFFGIIVMIISIILTLKEKDALKSQKDKVKQ